MKPFFSILAIAVFFVLIYSCNPSANIDIESKTKTKLPVIFDTDANNELDDQHALAYLVMNPEIFFIEGVTVNTTYNGGNIDAHYAEAERVLKLCDAIGKMPLIKGANGNFLSIQNQLDSTDFDGKDAVHFMIETAKKYTNEKLIIIAVGKLTNIALAIKKDPSIIKNIRLVWLGANYPEPGEYNLENDIPAMNYLLASNIHFEMVTVRYGKPSGTDAVKVTQEEINKKMPGLGPQIKNSVAGRHGKSFHNFGDYSISLFENIEYFGDPPSRALFDMAAVAIVKNHEWADSLSVPCPVMIEEKWVEQPNNQRKITLWENFNKDKILSDFYASFQ